MQTPFQDFKLAIYSIVSQKKKKLKVKVPKAKQGFAAIIESNISCRPKRWTKLRKPEKERNHDP